VFFASGKASDGQAYAEFAPATKAVCPVDDVSILYAPAYPAVAVIVSV